jgi:hypothetical protein
MNKLLQSREECVWLCCKREMRSFFYDKERRLGMLRGKDCRLVRTPVRVVGSFDDQSRDGKLEEDVV